MFAKKFFLSAFLSLFAVGHSVLGSTTALTIGTVLITNQKAIAQSAQSLLRNGAKKFKNNDYNGAIEDLNSSIEVNPKSYLAYFIRGAAKSAIEDYKGAIIDFTDALKIKPDESMVWYMRGTAKLGISEISNKSVAPSPGYKHAAIEIRESAIKDFNIAIQLDPNKANYYRARGYANTLIEDHEKALDDYRQALVLDKSDFTLYRMIGITHEISGNKSAACKNFKTALDAGDKGSIDLYKENCNNYTSKPEIRKSTNKSLAMVAWARGVENERQGKDQDAINDFTRAIELDPKNKFAYNSRALTKAKGGDYQGAIDDYTKGIEVDPGDPLMYRNRGVNKARLKDYAGAILDYNRVIEITPEDPFAYYLRGVATGSLGDIDAACLDLETAIKLGNEDAVDVSRRACVD